MTLTMATPTSDRGPMSSAAVAAPVTPARRRSSTGRVVAMVLVFILAVLATPMALVGNWGYRTVTDAAVYMETVTPLAQNPEIQAAVANAITDVVIQEVDVKPMVEKFLGGLTGNEQLSAALAAPITAGVNALIREVVARFVASSAFQDIWIVANKAAQKGILAVLEGSNAGIIRSRGDTIVLDISAMLEAVRTQLVNNGVTLLENVNIPDKNREIVLLESPAVAQVRLIYSLTSPILTWLPLIAMVLFLIVIALALRRWLAVLVSGASIIILAIVVSQGLDYGRQVFVDQLADTVFAGASEIFWNTFFIYLTRGLQTMWIIGILLVLSGLYCADWGWSTRLRESVNRGLAQIGSVFGSGALPTFVRQRSNLLRWVVCVVIALIAVMGDLLNSGRVVWLGLLTLGLLTLIQVLRGRVATQPPVA